MLQRATRCSVAERLRENRKVAGKRDAPMHPGQQPTTDAPSRVRILSRSLSSVSIRDLRPPLCFFASLREPTLLEFPCTRFRRRFAVLRYRLSNSGLVAQPFSSRFENSFLRFSSANSNFTRHTRTSASFVTRNFASEFSEEDVIAGLAKGRKPVPEGVAT